MWIVGRDPELAVLHAFVQSAGAGALVLSGGPGIGKTTLWEAGIDLARKSRLRVLSARPSGAEARRSYAALIDLLEGVDRETLAGLPSPQLHALEVALLRVEPRGEPLQPHAAAVGFSNGLRALAVRDPLLIAIDDVQWLDTASADALEFAARRLREEAVGFLLAKRSDSVSTLERVLEPRAPRRLEVGPLSLGATRRLLSERLELILPRRLLRRVFESAQGNPLMALELGRSLAQRGPPSTGEEIPLSDVVEDLLGTRVERLASPLRELLLAVALSGNPRATELAAIVAPGALDEAVDAGLVLVEGGRVRPSHPLLAAAAIRHSRSRERRELHVALGHAVAGEELRARHLALATEQPDAALAAVVAAAAAGASARGARQEAVELAEHALRLTPHGTAERTERVLALAQYLEVAGEPQRVTSLLVPELDALPPGAPRVRAQLLLSEGGGVVSIHDHRRHYELALAESGNDPVLRAQVLAKMAIHTAAACIERIADAEAWALQALPPASRAGPEIERLALNALAWARSLRGQPIDDVCERFRAASDAAAYLAASPERVAAQRLVWRGEVIRARAALEDLLAVADERGEPASYALQRLHACELELRAGEWDAASRLLDEWDESADQELLVFPMYERCRALLAAGRGLPDEAERWAARAIERAEATVRWDLLEALRARGVAALLAHAPERAVGSLRTVWEHTEREGVDEPGVFPVAPDLVEALVQLGELDEAHVLTYRLVELAEQQEHPWARATAKRCGALVRLASPTYDEAAAAALEEAADDYGLLGLRFDRARSLLSVGRVQRRFRKWGAARRVLEQAAAGFDEIGSVGWAQETRSELGRVGARRPQRAGDLTPAERRVVELAAAGLANKEIARTLFVGVHTVEVHLSHAYAKLGVRSRAQLAARFSADD
jgi:DNA-binding CsgD family transcriptional regulator